MIGEEAAAIFFGKNPGETPLITLESTNFEDVHNEDVARLSTVHPDRPTQDVNNLQVDVSNILRVVVVFDLSIGPVFALDPEDVAWMTEATAGMSGCQLL